MFFLKKTFTIRSFRFFSEGLGWFAFIENDNFYCFLFIENDNSNQPCNQSYNFVTS